MMMLKTDMMPLRIAFRMLPMPLTTAMMQAPIVWKTDLICGGRMLVKLGKGGRDDGVMGW